jgi:hypothetical protein
MRLEDFQCRAPGRAGVQLSYACGAGVLFWLSFGAKKKKKLDNDMDLVMVPYPT